MVIPYAMSYYATARGSLPKLVHCEQCGFEYVYLMTASARGEGTSFLFLDNAGASERSHAAAATELAAVLEKGCAVVPCPACGQVQKHMIPEARRSRYRWMKKAFFPLLVAAGALLLLTGNASRAAEKGDPVIPILWAVVALLAGCAVALPLLRLVLCCRYDPNRSPVERRQELGQKLAVSKERFLRAAREGPAAPETSSEESQQ
jgi:predicted RNA-binding Zn-ribbon protein involved in translation (DUF1610 family)